ncbi:hypothetical protein [Bacillus cereus]|uniref:hypothetical protein n=1 Tax=Bacillus cereus TaxID=1396 RepID=UPI0014315E3B|nr:hypothetical protein [Bacillus cereus]
MIKQEIHFKIGIERPLSEGNKHMNGATPQKRSYWKHEVFQKLQIFDSTLKRWANELEMSGYPFLKGVNKNRSFIANEIQTLEKYRFLIKKQQVKKEKTHNYCKRPQRKKRTIGRPPIIREMG